MPAAIRGGHWALSACENSEPSRSRAIAKALEAVGDYELAFAWIARNPGDAVKQLAGIGFQCRHELEKGVDPGDPPAVLQKPYLGAV